MPSGCWACKLMDVRRLPDPLVVAPTPTPFDADDRVDTDAMARNIERWNQTSLSGFVLGTANGEELSLSDDEKRLIVRAVAEARVRDRMIIAGIDTPSTTHTLSLADGYAAAGADMVRVRIPRQSGNDATLRYFGEVCSRSPLPVIVIHQTFTGVPAASPDVIARVCSHENVFGYIKPTTTYVSRAGWGWISRRTGDSGYATAAFCWRARSWERMERVCGSATSLPNCAPA